ncbi:MAG: cytochrome c biosis protein transrane region [Clostridiales bacterium]|jgi:cytochrome c-type biogenesis protein|nr:cytochrome c biosis protein transrane region [Clostridiales bacterium]
MTGEMIGVGAAFLAGLLSFFSPCVLPLIPAYLAHLSGSTPAELKNRDRETFYRVIKNAAGFVLGLSVTFILLGLTASALGKFLLQYQGLIMKAGGVIVIIFGLQLMGIVNFKSLLRDTRKEIKTSQVGFFNSLLMGFIFSAGWTPCIGPVLSSILVLAGSSGSLYQGMLLLSFYSLGLAIPFLLTALFIGWALEKLQRITPYLPVLNKLAGVLLIVLGIMLITNTFSTLSIILS